ncbi:MAG: hypothetical protein DRO95_05090 [Candidatus Altiarchaeales archaeon]|nr:MAG: hypothetical protein DRO95_05090 [Candidatus Altiarchaeales archaeon]HDO82427.1 hypothetical protein [Candidatus Altiarchaeales archaeon]HEX55076.1 hypothetical protein [Candidatus Altiarchaeales archaeon]
MGAFSYPWIRSMTAAGILLIMATGSVSAGCVGVNTGTDFICGDTVNESCTFNENLNCSGDGLIVEILLLGINFIIIYTLNRRIFWEKIWEGIPEIQKRGS